MTVALTVPDLICAACRQTVTPARQGIETTAQVSPERKTQQG